ncbi:hypothetical protein SAMD00023353_1200180 [Rosellinia necatrix]|uniref:Uncharacterized protein n=1 Tax=Rosellinia necatrix TaxID=77044 RepID=A0A1S8A6J0_ROSNE|nr:hypothetical protein SAMD00023353_1200180 [Rosellinia necatrix]
MVLNDTDSFNTHYFKIVSTSSVFSPTGRSSVLLRPQTISSATTTTTPRNTIAAAQATVTLIVDSGDGGDGAIAGIIIGVVLGVMVVIVVIGISWLLLRKPRQQNPGHSPLSGNIASADVKLNAAEIYSQPIREISAPGVQRLTPLCEADGTQVYRQQIW